MFSTHLCRDGTSCAKTSETQDESHLSRKHAQGSALAGGWNPPTGILLTSGARRESPGARMPIGARYSAFLPSPCFARAFLRPITFMRAILETPNAPETLAARQKCG